jgi:UDP-glucose:(heptosyl)LPS alpha-1,3-glucosyltransferase
MLTFAWASRKLVLELRKKRAVDVVIGFNHSVLHDVYRLGGGTMAALLRLTRDSPAGRGGPIVDRVALGLERARFREGRYGVLIAPSYRVRDELIRHYRVDGKRIEVIWNGIDLDRFHPTAPEGERASIRAQWGARIDEPLLLFVGQDPARKGFDVAVKVAEKVGVRMVYVGKARKPHGCPASVIWDGERSDVERCYRSADVLIAPSRYDPFGGVVLEALASGLPAVATDRIGATERVRGTPLEALLAHDPEDVEGFAMRVRLALDPERAAVFRDAAGEATKDAGREEWGRKMEAILEASAGRAV